MWLYVDIIKSYKKVSVGYTQHTIKSNICHESSSARSSMATIMSHTSGDIVLSTS